MHKVKRRLRQQGARAILVSALALGGCAGAHLDTGEVAVDEAMVQATPAEAAIKYLDEMVQLQLGRNDMEWSNYPFAFLGHMSLGHGTNYCVPHSQWQYDRPIPVKFSDVDQIFYDARSNSVSVGFGKCRAAIVFSNVHDHEAQEIAIAFHVLKAAATQSGAKTGR